MQIKIKNWRKYQHYSERQPPWIKLHFDILLDPDFHALSDASKWLLCAIWLYTARHGDKNGAVDFDERRFNFLLRTKSVNLQPLVDTGFIVVVQADASNAQADESDCSSETETETETELSAFAQFWEEYPKKKDKTRAEKAWKKIPLKDHSTIMDSLRLQKKSAQWVRDNGQYIPHPTSWLNGKRWEDEVDTTPTPPPQRPGVGNHKELR